MIFTAGLLGSASEIDMNIYRPIGGEAKLVSSPGIMGGMPCVAGTRVPAETIRVSLLAGEGKREIYSAYPYLPPGAVEAVIEWARANDLSC